MRTLSPFARRRTGVVAGGFWFLSLLGCGDGIVGTREPREQRVIIEDRISDESFRRWRFDLPKEGRNFRLSGSFMVTSGGSRDINARVVDKENYALYSRPPA